MSCLRWSAKDPDETLDYYLDFREEFEENGDNDAITGITVHTLLPVTTPPLVVSSTENLAGNMAKIWLTGGLVGATYELDIRVSTLRTRVYNKTVTISIKEQ